MNPIDQRVRKIFREVFENDGMQVTDSLSVENTPEWDSLAQIKLIVGLEEEFGIKFTTDEVMEANTVQALKQAIHTRLAG
jgi:acyl carrier protein